METDRVIPHASLRTYLERKPPSLRPRKGRQQERLQELEGVLDDKEQAVLALQKEVSGVNPTTRPARPHFVETTE